MDKHLDFLVDFAITTDELSGILIENPFYAGKVFYDLGNNLKNQAIYDKINNRPQLSSYLFRASKHLLSSGIYLMNENDFQSDLIEPHDVLIENIGQMSFDKIYDFISKFSRAYFLKKENFNKSEFLRDVISIDDYLVKAWNISKEHVSKITVDNLSDNYQSVIAHHLKYTNNDNKLRLPNKHFRILENTYS